ncbi:DUF3099 domain-containing protein [Paeniglutamicibacter sulfureus]|uniref:DUF3099 domain-containing protein n=1 Tax=Paeniglutamicibacter sulfureus TaxID=43666 RepID=UPI002665322F|nr:DUF3099 domain-containing protein [Paeniglutamicibacter sulfureus]MDO2936191.1 DUF3099 domain-containing protein [Paeniglutamicibacter sulfureus]
MSEPHHNHHHHDQGQPVHRITEAQESHTVEQHSRVLKYTISMSVRLACFIAAFFVHGWLQWTFLAAAIVLPYVAVVIANGGADVTKRQPAAEYFAGDDPHQLGSGTAAPETGNDQTHPTPFGEPTTGAAPARPWTAGESYEFDEFGETVTERATTEDASGSAQPDGSDAYWAAVDAPYPQEAPTTIDGSFVEDAEQPTEPGQPAAGRHRHGGTA